MIFFKQCPKCRGDMRLDKDIYGRYVECMQCGYMAEPGPNRVKQGPDLPREKAA